MFRGAVHAPDDPDPVLREGGTRYRLNFTYRVRVEGLVSSFNLATIDRGSRLPVFRPLIGFDKSDIISGSHDASSSRSSEYSSSPNCGSAARD